jgi:iron(III) transport system ATP-binding protein
MLSVRALKKTFKGREGQAGVSAVNCVSFDVKEGDFFTLLGPSGCGKSTILQSIAGLETPDEGEIEIGGEIVYSGKTGQSIPANRRNIGMIFQSYAIWPHMTVFDNVAFPLVYGRNRAGGADVRRRVMEVLELVKLADFADRPAPNLSGGQQQRVALARALVHRPRLLLLDEPLSNLDAKLREDMRVELRQVVNLLNTTTVFVTHDQVEAMAMSDQIALLRAGNIVQQGPPRDVYLKPQGVFTANFMGRSNLIPGNVTTEKSGSYGVVDTPHGKFLSAIPDSLKPGSPVFVVVRPHSARISEGGDAASQKNVVQAEIARLSYLGDGIEAEVTLGGNLLRVILDPYFRLSVGDVIRLQFPADHCVVIARTDDAEAEIRAFTSSSAPMMTDAAASAMRAAQ